MIQVAQILFILSVLVILHEFGHYITAKMFKVRVEKFYLFMDAGFSLVKKKIGETEWGIGWLPLGGYVKLSGMIDESMDTEQMNAPAEPWEFRSKPAWQRLIIMLGGIIVNVILAWLIFTIMYATVGQKFIATEKIQENGLAFGEVGQKAGFRNGDKILSVDGKHQPSFNRLTLDVLLGDKVEVERNGQKVDVILTDEMKGEIISKEGKEFVGPRFLGSVVDSVVPKSQAEIAGLKKGDKIKAVNGTFFNYYDEYKENISKHKNDSISLSILRGTEVLTLKAKVDKEGKLGFFNKPLDKSDYEVNNQLSFGQAVPAAVKESWALLVYNVKQFKLILRPKTEAYKHVQSPIGIARRLPDTWDWEFIWNFTALFSIGLAFMNLLPIPGLDGGHALFTIVEMITGKKLSDKAAGYVQTAGMIILLTLMALTFGKDIYQLVVDKLL
ncbi:MAG: RIP metalloprotease RseP [Flavobacterium sp.]|jgi:regulator of sigma E protease|uniref:RIP metalloprotease RseP n=1 Tax=Flavobacterium sp. TaxID=239 RepID=UPI0025BD6C7A|nr:RIP metalloprotease RseP [Flavobacterium sp.]MCA1965533.1 RIP metalloprotease RseP [Flavobacterium sp.]